jgi:hypothetical protein
LKLQKGNHADPAAENTSDRQQKLPTPFDDIQIYGDVTFYHKVLPGSETLPNSPSRLTVDGCLDCGIGRVIKHSWTEQRYRRRFHCFLAIVTAKDQFGVGLFLPQLLAYLASLRQSRLQRNWTDASMDTNLSL